MSSEPIGKFFTPGPNGQGDEHQFERLLRLVAALQASSPNEFPEETVVHQPANHASPIILKTDSLRREVELRAYQIYMERGGTHGCDMADWLQAEMELRERLGLGREKVIMRLALAWGMPHTPSEGASAPG
jgi:Protein of unknown function (DUF2934)